VLKGVWDHMIRFAHGHVPTAAIKHPTQPVRGANERDKTWEKKLAKFREKVFWM
jgi:hypothetical protein